MAAAQMTNELLLETVALIEEHGSMNAAARASGIPRCTLQNRIQRAAARGLMDTGAVMPGFEITSTTEQTGKDGEVEREWITQKPERGEEFSLPVNMNLDRVTAQVGPDGRLIQQWLKAKTSGEPAIEDIVAFLKGAFADYAPAAKVCPPPPQVNNSDYLTLIPCNDWHLGMFGWDKQTGSNWDLKIAEDAIGQGIEDTIRRSPYSDTAVVLGGGDLMHADNQSNETSHSGNQLDVDGRYPKVLTAACRLKVRVVDAALAHHRHVIVRVLPGNHDEHSAVAVAYFLLAWYRNEPRVTVDVDPSLFWWMRFGKVMLGATHGHTVKIAAMPQLMAHRRAEDWGLTKFRYVHGFHLHHSAKYATEGGGVISEVHQAPIPQDAWHWNSGYLSGRSMQAITYHREFGEVGRVRVAMLDAVTPQVTV